MFSKNKSKSKSSKLTLAFVFLSDKVQTQRYIALIGPEMLLFASPSTENDQFQ